MLVFLNVLKKLVMFVLAIMYAILKPFERVFLTYLFFNVSLFLNQGWKTRDSDSTRPTKKKLTQRESNRHMGGCLLSCFLKKKSISIDQVLIK